MGRLGRVLSAVACLAPYCAYGFETDPYTGRGRPVADSLALLDREVNATIDAIAASWSRGEDEWRFVTAIYRRIGGPHYVDRLERWAMKSPDVERIELAPGEAMANDFPILAARLGRVGPIIKVNGVYMGTDKIGHFLSQGRKFYRRYRHLGDEERAMHWSVTTERGLFGALTTGIYSNADLVANYEGYLFYRSLFHDGVVAGKPAILRWRDGEPVRQRAFTWADHVNAFWDEALNPNVYSKGLLPHVERRLLSLCDDYAAGPERYRVPAAQALWAHYRNAGLRPNRHLEPERFLAANCP